MKVEDEFEVDGQEYDEAKAAGLGWCPTCMEFTGKPGECGRCLDRVVHAQTALEAGMIKVTYCEVGGCGA